MKLTRKVIRNLISEEINNIFEITRAEKASAIVQKQQKAAGVGTAQSQVRDAQGVAETLYAQLFAQLESVGKEGKIVPMQVVRYLTKLIQQNPDGPGGGEEQEDPNRPAHAGVTSDDGRMHAKQAKI
jgi:hypothetical protein